jgi:S-formylglutathione hydrolase FrmB
MPRSRLLPPLTLLLVLALLPAARPASAASGGTTRAHLSFESAALGRPLHYAIYLPPGYDEEGARRYPVVYLLHGLGGRGTDWLAMGGLAATADRLIGAGEIPPVIVVMPDGADSWYVDSAAVGGPGDYQTAIGRDLIAHVDATWRTAAHRGGRAIAGLSMGGYGALRLAFMRPDMYTAVAGLSAAVFPDVATADAAPGGLGIFRAAFGAPFDPVRFDRLNVYGLVDDLAAVEDDPPGVYLTCGDDDGFGLWRTNIGLFLDLRDAGVPVEFRMTDGGHTWSLWGAEMANVLRFFAGRFGPSERAASEPRLTPASLPPPRPGAEGSPAAG